MRCIVKLGADDEEAHTRDDHDDPETDLVEYARLVPRRRRFGGLSEHHVEEGVEEVEVEAC